MTGTTQFSECYESADCIEHGREVSFLLLNQLNEEKAQSSFPVLCFISVIILVGTVGNALVLATYFKQIHKNSTNFFIFCLATFDFISCVISLPAEILILLKPLTYSYSWLCKVHKFVAFSANLVSGYTIVCISFDRYLRIARPHHRFHRSTCRRAVVAVVATSVLVCSMALFVYGSERVHVDGHPELLAYRCGTDPVAVGTFVPLLFSAIILLAFLVGVFILLTVYIRLGIVVRRWNKGRIKSTGNRKAVGCSDESSSKCDRPEKRQADIYPFQIPLLSKDINRIKGKDKSGSVDILSKIVPQRENMVIEVYNDKNDTPVDIVKSPTAETYLTDNEISETDENSVASLPVIRPGLVKEMTRSLEKNGFMIPDPSVHFDGTATLPLKKISAKQREVNRRKITRKKSLVMISDIKKRITLSKTTTMFIVATVAFVACHVPYVCVKFALVTNPDIEDILSSMEIVFYRLAEYSFTVSYAVNPIIYSFLNARFRVECRILIVRLLKRITCFT